MLSAAVSDSLGISYLNTALALLPRGRLTNTLTLGDLKAVSPDLKVQTSGVTAASWGTHSRADSINFDIVFEWNAGDVDDRTISDSAVISELEIDWRGADVRQFEARASQVLGALRNVPGTPSCISPASSVATESSFRTHAEVGWFASDWIGKLSMLAMKDSHGTTYQLQYRAFRLRPQTRKYYAPSSTSPECFPRLNDFVVRR